MNKELYLYINESNEDLIYYLNKILTPISFMKIKSNFFYLVLSSETEYINSIKTLESDFFIDISIFKKEIEIDSTIENIVYNFLKSYKKDVYTLSNVCEKLILKNDPNKEYFKKFFELRLNKDLIDAGLMFITTGNSISASNKLFIHRNTLNYRIESIKRITSLDLKKFNDQLVFYGLFN